MFSVVSLNSWALGMGSEGFAWIARFTFAQVDVGPDSTRSENFGRSGFYMSFYTDPLSIFSVEFKAQLIHIAW